MIIQRRARKSITNKKKILVIEDEPSQVMMVKFRLEANNFVVITACDGQEGLEKTYQEKPDLILLDVVMPKMNGYEVCNRLKQDPKTKKTPIIVFTASAPINIKEKCQAVGANDYIIKPFESAELVAKIKTWLEEK